MKIRFLVMFLLLASVHQSLLSDNIMIHLLSGGYSKEEKEFTELVVEKTASGSLLEWSTPNCLLDCCDFEICDNFSGQKRRPGKAYLLFKEYINEKLRHHKVIFNPIDCSRFIDVHDHFGTTKKIAKTICIKIKQNIEHLHIVIIVYNLLVMSGFGLASQMIDKEITDVQTNKTMIEIPKSKFIEDPTWPNALIDFYPNNHKIIYINFRFGPNNHQFYPFYFTPNESIVKYCEYEVESMKKFALKNVIEKALSFLKN